jgi:ADP-heptose:LPS heptosyltransferase
VRNPARILIVRLSHLGDVVHALGVFHALHAAFPAAEIGWAIQSEFAPLVEPLPGLERVLRFERRGGLGAWWRLRRELAAFRPDWCVDAQGNAKSAAAALLSRAPRRVAPARGDWQEPWAAGSANEHAPALPPGERHAMQRMQRLAEHLVGHVVGPVRLRLDAALRAEELEAAERALAERLPRSGAAPVLLHLSSPEDVRGWPAERWGELARGLAREGRGVLVLSGPGEAELGRRLAFELAPEARIAHWTGQRGLRELAAVFAVAARRALALVACDSGPMHLAAAHGLRVVALEGPQDGARTGPWPLPASGAPGHAVVRSSRELPCAPCLRRRCALPEGPLCMRELAVADVLAALGRAR